ncbi:MAG: acyl-CoA dehydrogenase family protein [Gammaproteobacteria bacterium]|nr:acyl-CoA dehydrogenase family protein [Gammaproteobacteria bacterium]
MSTNRDEFSEIARQIAELKPIIEAHADEAEEQRHLGNEVARSMALAGLYRIAVPRSLGGGEAHPITQIKTIEAVSEIHGSTGWNLMIGIETMGILGGSLTRSVTKQLYADPELVIAGTLNPLGQAVPCDGGYRITGQWPFASGIHNAQYFWSQSIVQKDGERLKDERGFVFCESMVPVSQVEILDTWHVSGLRGSGSHDVRLEDVFVSTEYISQVQRRIPVEPGTLYRLPIYSRLAYNKVGVATGIAKAAINQFVELANAKKPRGSSNLLKNRVDAQRAIAEAERLIGSARSYVFEAVTDIWDTIENGDKPTDRQKAIVQLSCSGAANEAVKAVEMLYSAAGASANFLSSPLERSMRDVLVVRQHIMVSPQYTEAVGRVLLGMESETFLF